MAEASEVAKVPSMLTAASFVEKAVEGVRDWRRLGVWLKIPESTLGVIRRQHSDDMGRMEALISHWLMIDPSPSWRRLIVALDVMRHQTADRIRGYAEPLTDPTLTLRNVTKAVASIQDWNLLALRLGVPGTKLDELRTERSTNDKRKEATWDYWMRYCPVVSWGKLAGELHRLEEKKSLKQVKKNLKTTTEPTLTLPNLCQALAEVENWHGFCEWLGVPSSKHVEIRQKKPSDDVKVKQEILHQFLTAHPAPSWRVVFEGLYQLGQDEPNCHTILQKVGRCYGRDMVLPAELFETKKVERRRSMVSLSKSSAIAPLVFFFPAGQPIGIYISLVSFLLSSENRHPYAWEFHCSAGSPTCLYQNCVKFTIPNNAGSIMLINSSSYFEAHVNAPDTTLCRFVRDAIFTGLKKLSTEVDNFGHSRPLPELAVICPCKVGSAHAATVGANQMLICVKGSEKWGKLQPDQSVWFPELEQEQPTTPRRRLWSFSKKDTDSGTCTPSRDVPTLPELIMFQGLKRKINIPQEIGARYMAFGTLLLKDDRGTKLRIIETKHHKDAAQINTEVLQEWVRGLGKQPVTWDTLISVLKDAKLAALAHDIATGVKCP